jgi:hypothetical protein
MFREPGDMAAGSSPVRVLPRGKSVRHRNPAAADRRRKSENNA